jgi:polysaccharide biosynthesis protein PslH
MEPILFLVHRIPFPPTKGDKVRSFHLLEFLASRYRVHLGTFVDDAADRVHVPRLADYCATTKVIEFRPIVARLRSLSGFLSGEPLSLPYYRDAALEAWVREVIVEHGIRKVIVFSSAMAQYVMGIEGLRIVVDFVDVDSTKWEQYAETRRWPLSAVFAREGKRLLQFDRSVAARADASVFVTRVEADLFCSLAPEAVSRVRYAQNGVDHDFFSPEHALPDPYQTGEEAIVFTGAMDYWPNIDAVCWFAREILPIIASKRPNARFYIVGVQPAPAVQSLARSGPVVVTGRVKDVRPYLKYASVVVAPLRVARGVQNKVLEAMAMGRPIVATSAAAVGLSGVSGVDFEVADDAADFARKTLELAGSSRREALGKSARARVVRDYNWSLNLAAFDTFLRAPAAA